jgi:esterase/lipase
MTHSRLIESRFIETKHGPMFVSYNEPQGDLIRTSAILLLYPGDQEYKRVHWAYRGLAANLAKNGWPVLRFDYHGTGDSGGLTSEGTIDTWTDGAVAAAEFLKDRSGAIHIQVVGIRLGALIAARLTSAMDVLSTVLWDPFASGADYLDEMRSLERQHRRYDHFKKVKVPALKASQSEFCAGFPLNSVMEAEIKSVTWQSEKISSPFLHVVLSKNQPESIAASLIDRNESNETRPQGEGRRDSTISTVRSLFDRERSRSAFATIYVDRNESNETRPQGERRRDSTTSTVRSLFDRERSRSTFATIYTKAILHRADDLIGWGDFMKTQEALMAPHCIKVITNIIERPNHE